MKVTRIEVRKIKLPLKEPFIISYNKWWDMPSIIIKLETDEGIVGWGESVPDEGVTGETIDSVFAMLVSSLSPLIMGEDPLKIEGFHKRANDLIYGGYGAKASIDIALHDILGKFFNKSLTYILGGGTNTVEAPGVISIKEPKEVAQDIKRYIADGYNQFKLKLGDSMENDILRVKMAREAGGSNIRLKVDANQGWGTWDKALGVIRELIPYNLEVVEQPVKQWDYDGLKRVRDNSPIPIMVDEGVKTGRDLLSLIKHSGIDWVNIKLMKCGGILPAVKMAHIAEAAGIKVQIGSMLESSIGSYAGAHIHRALECVKSSEMVGPRWFAKDIGEFSYDGCKVIFPSKPGLGTDIDEELLKSLTVEEAVITGTKGIIKGIG
jgi:L-alanine-DL-glutamate epimerase-like enolase superfamily enzyme